MKKRRPRPPPKAPNLAAKALGSKIFGLKIVTPKKGYIRRPKHRKGSAIIDPLPASIVEDEE
jgi:hypothetical protein